ncbi:cytochrome c3 family protein [Desulfococcus sp.]|uniref:cytochrome c3 family protein n=1 Tax=Desulfococcus sp. TaxID=2025834 RepID=UPI0035937E0B
MKWIETIRNVFRAVRDNRVPIFWIGSLSLLTAGFLFLFYASPATDIGPEQPIPFSHRLHSGVKAIDCKFCHPYVARSRHPGLPPVEKCLYCHAYIIAGHPQILKEHGYYETETPTPWVKANFLPEHVLFNHQRHIKKNFVCAECHDQVETMDRIKGKRFKMGFCVQCHQKNQGPLDCWLTCHS